MILSLLQWNAMIDLLNNTSRYIIYTYCQFFVLCILNSKEMLQSPIGAAAATNLDWTAKDIHSRPSRSIEEAVFSKRWYMRNSFSAFPY